MTTLRALAFLIALPVLAACQDLLAETISGEVVSIADGDTLTLLVDNEQHRIRLAGIDTPESGQPWGNRARQALADRVFRRQVEVKVMDEDRYGRLVGHVYVDRAHVNRDLVGDGHAWVYRRYARDPALYEAEKAARAAKRGLWGLPESQRVPPWEWRRSD